MDDQKSEKKNRPKANHIHDRMVVVREWYKGELVKHTITFECEPPCPTSATQEQLPW